MNQNSINCPLKRKSLDPKKPTISQRINSPDPLITNSTLNPAIASAVGLRLRSITIRQGVISTVRLNSAAPCIWEQAKRHPQPQRYVGKRKQRGLSTRTQQHNISDRRPRKQREFAPPRRGTGAGVALVPASNSGQAVQVEPEITHP